MQFSDTTNKNGAMQMIERSLGFPDGKITGDTNLFQYFTQLFNNQYDKIQAIIFESMDSMDFDDINLTDKHPVATRPLVANQRDYIFSTTLWSLIATEGGSAGSDASISPLKIKRVDICWNGTGNTCYKAEPLDIAEIGTGIGNDTDLDNNFDIASPFYDVSSQGINIYPRANAGNVTNNGILRVEFRRDMGLFTTADTTKTPGIDRVFHPMLYLGVAMEYAAVKRMKISKDVSILFADLEVKLRNRYGNKNEDRQIIMKQAYQNME